MQQRYLQGLFKNEDPKCVGTKVPKNIASKIDATIFSKLKC